jgi:uncharacterized protein YjbI with pentapeptide repeats
MFRKKSATPRRVAKTVLLISILSMLPPSPGVASAASCNLKAKRVICPNADLRKANFKGANLRDANLRGANLQGVNIKDARNWEGADLSGANLISVRFHGTTNFKGANLTKVKFVGAKIYGTGFCRSSAASCAVLDSTDFSKANAKFEYEGKRFGKKITLVSAGASFYGAVLTNVSFNGADLTGSNFYSADLKSASFEGAVVAGVWFYEAIASETTFIGAIYGPGLNGRGTVCPKVVVPTIVGPCSA